MKNATMARLNYFTGQALLTDDFKLEQQYYLNLLRINNASLRTYGIARGLEVQWQQGSLQLSISPGMAIDSLGREIILLNREIIKLDDHLKTGPYYLTINYHEVFADLTDNGGVKGYNQVVQQPQFNYSQVPDNSGSKILLAVINIGNNSQVNKLTSSNSFYVRRYVGSVVGSVQLVTEGAGVSEKQSKHGVLSMFSNEVKDHKFSSIVAKKETHGSGDYIEVDASRTQYMGALTTRANVGIGIDEPEANLQISSINFKSSGTLTSNAQQVTFQGVMSPFLAVGDIITTDKQVTRQPQTRRVTKIISVDIKNKKATFTIDNAFSPDLNDVNFTYIRATLARFSTNTYGDLLHIGYDGTVGLGVKLAKNTGGADSFNALQIRNNGNVGIGLDSREPTAMLEVNGNIQSSGNLQIDGDIGTQGNMVSQGKVIASSFEGNGSKLKGLPILSYWVKESVAQQNSKLHYNEGNVGIMTTNPPASLSVGGGQSIVGSGVVTFQKGSGKDPDKLIGNNTRFTKEIHPLNLITVGKIVPQPVEITKITSDTQLEISTQIPFVVSNASFQTLLQGETEPVKAKGTVSSNGTIIFGNGTKFKSLQLGDSIVIDAFKPASGQYRHVAKVVNDNTLTLQKITTGTLGANNEFTAVDSAYMITSALLGQYQVDDSFSVLMGSVANVEQADDRTQDDGHQEDPKSKLPPAFIAMANGDNNPDMAPNTVAINVPLTSLDSKYALQVLGDVSFTGGGSNFDKLTVEDLIVTENLTVNSTKTDGNIITVGAKNKSNLFNVTTDNVQIGTQSGLPGSDPLEVNGDIYTPDNVKAKTSVTSSTVNAGNLISTSMTVAGTHIANDGSVSIFSDRSNNIKLTSSNSSHQDKAATDGFVQVLIGKSGKIDAPQLGAIVGMTASSPSNFGNPTSTASAATFSQNVVFGGQGKKGSPTTVIVGISGSFTLPVKKGETWKITLMQAPAGAGLKSPSNESWFVPLGPAPGGAVAKLDNKLTPPSVTAESVSPQAASMSPEDVTNNSTAQAPSNTQDNQSFVPQMLADHEKINENFAHTNTPQASQAIIDKRMNDLTKVLSKASPIQGDKQAGEDAFVNQLRKIVCAVDQDTGDMHNNVKQQDITKLISTFSRITGKKFNVSEQALLQKGINALVEINANDENRHDLSLANNNIDSFIKALETATHEEYSDSQKRLLKRALVRLVGDGSQEQNLDDGTGSDDGIQTATGTHITPTTSVSDGNSNPADNTHPFTRDHPGASDNSQTMTAEHGKSTDNTETDRDTTTTEKSQDNENHPGHQFIKTVESIVGKAVSSGAKNFIKQEFDRVLNRGKTSEDGTTDIVRHIEKDVGAELESAAKAVVVAKIKSLLGPFL